MKSKTPLFSWPVKLRMASELFLPRGETNGDESLGAFVRRRFGNGALERVAQPLVGGIYASDPDKLSLGATMPRFKEMEKSSRSVIYAMWSAQRQRAKKAETGSGARWSLFVTLAGGMQELIATLIQRLPQETALFNAAATELERNADDTWRVAVGHEQIIEANAVILATPAFRTGALLRQIDSSAAEELTAISYASTATVSLAYRREDFPQAPNSFGFVVPAVEKCKIMACTFSSIDVHGFDLTQKISRETRGRVPVILITGLYRGPQYRQEATSNLGAAEYFEKPVDQNAFVAAVKRLLHDEDEFEEVLPDSNAVLAGLSRRGPASPRGEAKSESKGKRP